MPSIGESPEIKRLERKLTIELLWIYILSILKEKELHAYALRKEVSEKFGFLPGNVSAYVVLYKLESRGFVEGRREENKKIYSITAKGAALLETAGSKLESRRKMLFG